MADIEFPDPALTEIERTTYHAVLHDQEIGSGTLTVTPYPDRYTISVELSGSLSGVFADAATEVVLLRENGIVRAATYTSDGQIKGEHGQSVGHDEGRLMGVKALNWGGEVAEYPRNILPLVAVPLVLRGQLRKSARVDFPLWLLSVLYWPVHAKVEGNAKVTTPLGEARAWRVRFRPDLHQVVGPLDRVVQPLIPPFVGYFDQEPPHRFIRFEFPTGPFPWNPRGVLEATDVSLQPKPRPRPGVPTP